MRILAIEVSSRDAPPELVRPHLRGEALRVWELWQAGIIRDAYFRQDRPEAVLMLECRDPAEARLVLQSLPLVQAGLIAFDLFPLRAYSGFSRLFAK